MNECDSEAHSRDRGAIGCPTASTVAADASPTIFFELKEHSTMKNCSDFWNMYWSSKNSTFTIRGRLYSVPDSVPDSLKIHERIRF